MPRRQGRAGHARAGQGWSRAGQVRTGQDREGQGRADRQGKGAGQGLNVKTKCNVHMQLCSDQSKLTQIQISTETETLPGQWEVALSDLSTSRDIMHGSELHNVIVFLSPIKVIISSHIGHAVMVQERRHLVYAASPNAALPLHDYGQWCTCRYNWVSPTQTAMAGCAPLHKAMVIWAKQQVPSVCIACFTGSSAFAISISTCKSSTLLIKSVQPLTHCQKSDSTLCPHFWQLSSIERLQAPHA